MGVPKSPNTAAATAAVKRRGDETAATRLRAAGWTVTPPEDETPAVRVKGAPLVVLSRAEARALLTALVAVASDDDIYPTQREDEAARRAYRKLQNTEGIGG